MTDKIRDKLWADIYAAEKAAAKFAGNPAHEADMAIKAYDKRVTATPSPPVAAPPATPVWDGKLPEALQRKLNALRLECAPAIVSDVEHEVRSVFEGMHTSLATVKRMYAAARDRLEAAEPQVDPFAQPQPQPAQPLTGARSAEMRQQMIDECGDDYEKRGIFASGWLGAERAHGITAPSTPTPPEAAP